MTKYKSTHWFKQACKMCGNEAKVPPQVIARLKRLAVLCSKAGGELRSRQVIAAIILQVEVESRSFGAEVHIACVGGSTSLKQK